MAEIYITSQELVKTLKINGQELVDIEEFFDSIPDDEWELVEGKDYKIVNKTNGLREYTQSGAYTIARYLEATRKPSFWDLIKEWFLHTKREIRRNFVRKKIRDNSSSLIKRKELFFISKADAVVIFGTRSDYLAKMAEYAKRMPKSLIEGTDYETFVDGGEHFSLEGIYKLAQAFKDCHTKKNRREWCEDVGEVITFEIEHIVSEIRKREQRIQTAMDRVKKRDKNTCQVTRTKSNRVDKVKLAAHHLYCQSDYPHLADVENNLITLTCEVHDQFHQSFMGGSQKLCTIEHFIDFVAKYYPSNTQVIVWLEQQKLVLGNQQPANRRKPHVLYLPASRVS